MMDVERPGRQPPAERLENKVAKEGQQMLLSPHAKTQIMALAVVRHEAQAEVGRRLVDIALPKLRREHAQELAELHEIFAHMGVEPRVALDDMTKMLVRADGERRTATMADLWTPEGEWLDAYPFGTPAAPARA